MACTENGFVGEPMGQLNDIIQPFSITLFEHHVCLFVFAS